MGNLSDVLRNAAEAPRYYDGIDEEHNIYNKWQPLLDNDRHYVYVPGDGRENQSFDQWKTHNDQLRATMNMSPAEQAARNEMEKSIETLHKPRVDMINKIRDEEIDPAAATSRTADLQHLIDHHTQETRYAQLNVLMKEGYEQTPEIAARFRSPGTNLNLQYLKEHLDDAETTFRHDLNSDYPERVDRANEAVGLIGQYKDRIGYMEQTADRAMSPAFTPDNPAPSVPEQHPESSLDF
ncbi:MAG: hypothetical protein H6868_02865 [Rhodospirillales bacterium]|nr:hypothetical protein [Rhodospirillales bacterium]